jgi:hypothetical protein
MNDTELFLAILMIHWTADFILQTHWQATNKSKNNIALLMHTLTYSVSWLIYLVIIGISFKMAVLFCLATFAAHTFTDYFTSRKTAELYARKDYHNFFVIIGLDQILHYIQLWFTFKWLINL